MAMLSFGHEDAVIKGYAARQLDQMLLTVASQKGPAPGLEYGWRAARGEISGALPVARQLSSELSYKIPLSSTYELAGSILPNDSKISYRVTSSPLKGWGLNP